MTEPANIINHELAQFREVIAHNGKLPIRVWRARHELASSNVRFIDVALVPPGGEIGLHTHALDNEEIYIIMSGSARMHIDGTNITAAAGDIIVNKPGGTHGLVNPGPEMVQLVVLEVRTAS